MATREANDGYAWVYVGEKGDDGHYTLTIKDKGSVVMKLSDVTMQMPTTKAALKVACAEDTLEFTDIDGNEFKFSGVEASAAKKYIHASESCRGLGRRKDKSGKLVATPADVRDAYANFTAIGAGERRGFQQKQVSEDETANLSKDELIALLKSKGMLKTA